MLRILALLFGLAFIAAGLFGFVPALSPKGYLFGIFQVDYIHNLFHIVSGVFAIIASTKTHYARLFFQIFGVIYALITVVGLILEGNLFVMHFNMADNLLHLVIAIVAIYLGFFTNQKSSD